MADNASAFAALDAHIARLRQLPHMAEDAAPEVASELREETARQIAAGLDPEGRPLQATQDGRRPLATAKVMVGAVGRTIYLRLTGHLARHHLGRAKGGVVRRLIPVDRLPPKYADVIRSTLERRFGRIMGGES